MCAVTRRQWVLDKVFSKKVYFDYRVVLMYMLGYDLISYYILPCFRNLGEVSKKVFKPAINSVNLSLTHTHTAISWLLKLIQSVC